MRTRVVKNVGAHGTFECSTNKDNLMLLLLAANSAKHGQGSEVNVRLEDNELGIVLSLCDEIQSFKGIAYTLSAPRGGHYYDLYTSLQRRSILGEADLFKPGIKSDVT